MDDGLLRYRGHYNADDQDVINAAAAKVGEQHLAWGEDLVNSSYILLLDFFNIRRPVDEKTGEVSDLKRQGKSPTHISLTPMHLSTR